MNETRHTIFVYGSLKRGKKNFRLMGKDHVFLGNDTVKGKLFTNGFYPYLTEGENDIPGEIYEVSNKAFKTIDKMERAAGYIPQQVTTKNGKLVPVYFYYDIEETNRAWGFTLREIEVF